MHLVAYWLLVSPWYILSFLLVGFSYFVIMFGPMVSIVISVMRLIQLDYYSSDDAGKGKLKAALFAFYSLALNHGVGFYSWFLLRRLVMVKVMESVHGMRVRTVVGFSAHGIPSRNHIEMCKYPARVWIS